jgi:hypothetical protein
LPWLVACVPAHAYRPFDGTDAAVVDEHEFELELGPVQYAREGSAKSLVAPALVGNYGLAGDREVVLEGKVFWPIGGGEDNSQPSFADGALSFKQLLRRGSLQDASGVSVAIECGILLPTIHAEPGAGASCALVASHRWSAATAHLNGALSFDRDHHWNRFASLIVESPDAWLVRPVAEVTVDQEVNGPRTRSALAGLIWRARETLSFDLGVRYGRSGDESIREIRAGLTWTVPPGN